MVNPSVFNTSSRGVIPYTFTSSNNSAGKSDKLTDNILFGQLTGVRFLNNDNILDAWDCTIKDANGLQIYTSSSISSDDSHANNFVVPSKLGTAGTTEMTYPISGQLSVSIDNATANSKPQVIFYMRQ